ncbi:hypothetical protein ACFE04_022587 [Oxalis oulophora]
MTRVESQIEPPPTAAKAARPLDMFNPTPLNAKPPLMPRDSQEAMAMCSYFRVTNPVMRAIEKMNGMLLNVKPVSVGPFVLACLCIFMGSTTNLLWSSHTTNYSPSVHWLQVEFWQYIEARFGYQPQLVPVMRPVADPLRNFLVPMIQLGQHGQRNEQPMPMMQPQDPVYQNPPLWHVGRPEVPYPSVGAGSGLIATPYDLTGVGTRESHFPIAQLSTLLAIVSPREQRILLGEHLYPLVEALEPETAAKVTGMLLELNQTEVLQLLESPDALRARVNDAMDVLRRAAAAAGTADQEGAAAGGTTTDTEGGAAGGSTADQEGGAAGGSTADQEGAAAGGSTADQEGAAAGGNQGFSTLGES